MGNLSPEDLGMGDIDIIYFLGGEYGMGYVAGYITNSMLTIIGFNGISQSILIQWGCKRVSDCDIYIYTHSAL